MGGEKNNRELKRKKKGIVKKKTLKREEITGWGHRDETERNIVFWGKVIRLADQSDG